MTNKTFAGKPPAQAAAESHARRRAGALASPQTCMIDLPGVPRGIRVCRHRPAEPIGMRLGGQDTIHPLDRGIGMTLNDHCEDKLTAVFKLHDIGLN